MESCDSPFAFTSISKASNQLSEAFLCVRLPLPANHTMLSGISKETLERPNEKPARGEVFPFGVALGRPPSDPTAPCSPDKQAPVEPSEHGWLSNRGYFVTNERRRI